ncbi:MAG: hypothetical protein V3W04_13160 [Gammaproteobacteria bacterium]
MSIPEKRLVSESYPSSEGISVVFYDGNGVSESLENQGSTKNLVIQFPGSKTISQPARGNLAQRLIFNPIHPSAELPLENLIELRKVHTLKTQHRKNRTVKTPFQQQQSRFTETTPTQKSRTKMLAGITIAVAALLGILLSSNFVPADTHIQMDEPESGIVRIED